MANLQIRTSPFVSFAITLMLATGVCVAQEKISLQGSTLTLSSGWTAFHDTKTTYLLEHHGSSKKMDATASVQVENRRDHAEAVKRLAQIAAGFSGGAYRLIGGWPAFERKVFVAYPYPGLEPQDTERERKEEAKMPRGHGGEKSWRATTAVAVGNRLVRIDTLLLPTTSPDVADLALESGRTLSASKADEAQSNADLQKLNSGVLAPGVPTAKKPPVGKRGLSPSKNKLTAGGGSVRVNGGGEIEAAASMDGQSFVTDAGCSAMFSTDGGATFNASTITGIPAGTDGDCTVTWGQSGNFYWGFLGTNSLSVYRSTDNGNNFNFVKLGVDHTTPPTINVDQEHLAADRWNASASSKDRVYIAWHETGNFVSRVACSSDSGDNWGAPVNSFSGTGGFPRVAVGRDGMVYVASRDGSNIIVDKFSDCDAGLNEQAGFPISILISDVVCPNIAGLDRCNDGNTLSSPTIAVDDTDASHVFLAWSQTTGAGQDITVTDSKDGGLTWGPTAVVNGGPSAIRFMPWLSAWGGVAYTGWYDRRAVTAANNDFTRYYRGSASQVHGVLTAGQEFDLMGTDDAQCDSGWPGGTRSSGGSDSCSKQPQLAGFCSAGTHPRCDFNATTPAYLCNNGGLCQTSSGSPKYGDYNGSAAGGGRLLNIWASGTAPSDLPAAPNHTIRAYTVVTDLPSDFFVRDWTDNADTHDMGQEPSTRDDFFSTSDVWSQVIDALYAPVNDWVAGDNAQTGTNTAGDNFAFARVSRRAAAASDVPPINVTLHFLVSDFGLGMPFVAAGSDPDPTLTFLAADKSLTLLPGYKWHLPDTASTHVCLAVEVSAPDDIGLPSLSGNIPGASQADPIVRNDNNKAQRNLYTVPGTSGGGGGFGWSHISVHEARPNLQMQIVFRVPHDIVGRLKGARVGVVGGEMRPLVEKGTIPMPRLKPSGYGMIAVQLGQYSGKLNDRLPITFQQLYRGKVVNGATIEILIADLKTVIKANLREHTSVLRRLSDTGNVAEADSEEQYLSFLKAEVPRLEAAAGKVIQSGTDTFRLRPSLASMRSAISTNNAEAAAAAHQGFLDRLDAAITSRQWKVE